MENMEKIRRELAQVVGDQAATETLVKLLDR